MGKLGFPAINGYLPYRRLAKRPHNVIAKNTIFQSLSRKALLSHHVLGLQEVAFFMPHNDI
jgi:hypothetical protein